MSGTKAVKASGSSTGRGGSGLRVSNVRALAGREIKRTWHSYLTSGIFNFLFGLVAISFMFVVWEGVVSGQAAIEESSFVLADLFFVFVLANLAANWTSTRYLSTKKDLFSEYLEFLRTLPVLTSEAVAARAAVMLAAAAVMSCVFFAPLYVFAGERIWSTLGLGHYLCFASMWAAYGLISGGMLLYLELGVRGAVFRFWCMMVISVVLLGAVLVCNLVLDVRLVAGTLVLTGEYGALAALGALAVGISGFTLLAVATAHRIGRRI